MWRAWNLVVLVALAGCAAGRVSPERLRISARDAEREARIVAAGWADDAALRFVEGVAVRPDGFVFPDTGAWRFAFEAPDHEDQLLVTITPRTVEQMTRPKQTPTSFVLGEAALPEEWIDSPAAIAAARTAGAGPLLSAAEPTISMLLLPLRPPQWVVRVAAGGESGQWRIDARSGAVLGS